MGIFSPPKVPSAQPLPPAPTIEDAEGNVRASNEDQAKRRRAVAARRGTVLTSPLGVSGNSSTTGERKALLG